MAADSTTGDAPPKQVATAMERLGQVARLIADVRLGADRLVEAIFVAAEPHGSNKALQLIVKEDSAMRKHLQDLRSIGKQLEDSHVLNDALLSRSNSWGLHMPLVCPDGAVVAYAWKRQLAGQAGASAVDRTRLALKSFMEQKKRFFPHLDIKSVSKRHCGGQPTTAGDLEEVAYCKNLKDTLNHLSKEIPDMKIFAYQRIDWSKRTACLPSLVDEVPVETSISHSFPGANKPTLGSLDAVPEDHIAIIEVVIPFVLRAVISLHPVGSTMPNAVALFSPDEGGRYVHARGVSVYHVFRHITEYSSMALQYFIGVKSETALNILLQWIKGYETLFSQPCCKCQRVLSVDKQSSLILPPVLHRYRQFYAAVTSSSLPKDQNLVKVQAFHIGCSS